MLKAILSSLLVEQDTPSDLLQYGWVQLPWHQGRQRMHRVGGIVVHERASGRIETMLGLDAVTLPWWCGWREDQRIAVLCMGTGA